MYEDADLFLEAQNSVYEAVIHELKIGRKTSHWMWFVFPQLADLGQSDMSQLYGLNDLDEAAEYYSHPELSARLDECTAQMLRHAHKHPVAILGKVDARKFQSSMTLFEQVPDASAQFAQALDAFYGGGRCARTLHLIG